MYGVLLFFLTDAKDIYIHAKMFPVLFQTNKKDLLLKDALQSPTPAVTDMLSLVIALRLFSKKVCLCCCWCVWPLGWFWVVFLLSTF